ncbi:hypothetical protein ABIB51_003948 [Arthrobacter sp. UYCu712]
MGSNQTAEVVSKQTAIITRKIAGARSHQPSAWAKSHSGGKMQQRPIVRTVQYWRLVDNHTRTPVKEQDGSAVLKQAYGAPITHREYVNLIQDH